jgi:hypothetical protein
VTHVAQPRRWHGPGAEPENSPSALLAFRHYRMPRMAFAAPRHSAAWRANRHEQSRRFPLRLAILTVFQHLPGTIGQARAKISRMEPA